jgi:hypothetical protein
VPEMQETTKSIKYSFHVGLKNKKPEAEILALV